MLCAHTETVVRAAEAARMADLPAGALMRQAATGLGHAIGRLLLEVRGAVRGSRVVLLVGSGDNGGDALHAGADLLGRGVAVQAVLLAERPHAEAMARFTGAGGRTEEPHGPVDVIVDGIVGIGGRPGLRPEALAALARLRAVAPEATVVAVDLPSGVDVDTGECPGEHVRADLTVTFGTHKPAHLVDPAAAACGRVDCVDLGLDLPSADLTALTAADVAQLLPTPDPLAHKYTRGVLGVLAGSDTYPGAGVLAVAGAATGLCGMVRYLAPSAVAQQLVLSAHPEVVPATGRVQAWAVGSGLDRDAPGALATAVADARTTSAALVLDAGALPSVAEDPSVLRGLEVVLTPHAGELAAMLHLTRAEVEQRALHHVRAAAARYGAVVLLKGRRTLVAAPDGPVRVNTTGTRWLAGAGSGDVLTGLIGSLLAAGVSPFDAAAAGAWLHGRSAERASARRGGGPIVASDVARALPEEIGATLQHAPARVGDSNHD